ncbi:hypothetical protein D9758_010638 [Tetrapyrgos nigripes]|uniref:Uncharacterized protein n=1 Tax=Tetrapyrgos nigripes TaxID=182062 RepID=A0A8H5GGQ3_9AGAR|nr:hypothetical protein D9758_010638 [Tetrapyrgos nigripes]
MTLSHQILSPIGSTAPATASSLLPSYCSPSSFLAHKLADTRQLDGIITSSSLQSAGVPAAAHMSRFLVQKYGWYGCGIDAHAGSSRAGPWKLQLCGLRRLRAREEHGIIDVAEEVKRYASART